MRVPGDPPVELEPTVHDALRLGGERAQPRHRVRAGRGGAGAGERTAREEPQRGAAAEEVRGPRDRSD